MKLENRYSVESINNDIKKSKRYGLNVGAIHDGFHSFNDLYEYRKVYNALLFNAWAKSGEVSVSKAKKHHNGEHCFGLENEWFIVVAELTSGQISNHYKMKDWDLFDIPEFEVSPVIYDGHTPHDALFRMYKILGKDYQYPLD